MTTPEASYGQEAAYLRIRVDGRPITLVPAPRLLNGQVLVPVQSFLKVLGATVQSSSDGRSIDGTRGSLKVGLIAGASTGWANNLEFFLDVPAGIHKGTMYAPLTFVSEALGGSVRLDTYSADITIGDADRPSSFSLGSSQVWVSAVMGPPRLAKGHAWYYPSGSVVEFDEKGQVDGWNNTNGNLKAYMGPRMPGAWFDRGSSKTQVVAALGTPTVVYAHVWYYGSDWVQFDAAGLVEDWKQP